MSLPELFAEIRACRVCASHLPLGPRPIIRGNAISKILIIGQAPGIRVHASGIPWDDESGNRLRIWLGLTPEQFYDEDKVAIMPMGFCYPGKGKSGDLPPRRECSLLWHDRVLSLMPEIMITVLVGHYAQARYLKENRKKNLTETVKAWREYESEGYLPIVHPSPRNGIWLRKNSWFENDVVPFLQQKVRLLI